MTLILFIISIIDLYSKLLILFFIIDILTKATILNENSHILKKINSALFLIFNPPLKLIRKNIPYRYQNLDFSLLILFLALWIIKYILYKMI